MLYHQIPALFYSLSPRFKEQESVRITHSQYDALSELVASYCKTHDAPRLKKLIARIRRRMEDKSDHHIWHSEFDYISETLLSAMQEVGFCRDEDNIETVVGILNRDQDRVDKETIPSGRSRATDDMMFSQSVKSMFNRWLN